MDHPTIDDDLWEQVEPLLPTRPSRNIQYAGRKPKSDRECLAGIIYVLRHGIGWESLPRWPGFPSGITCWRRLRAWQELGVWDELHRAMLDRLRADDRLDWERAAVDSSSIRARGAGGKNRPKSSR